MGKSEQPLTKTIDAAAARQQWSQLLNQVHRKETRVIVEQGGIPIAAIVSAEDLQQLQNMEEARLRDFQVALHATREAFKDLPDEELEHEVARALAAVRVEQRAAVDQQRVGTARPS